MLVDLVAHRQAHVIGVREAAVWSVVWVACGVGFGALIWWHYGADLGQQHFAGYLIEKSLAVDNVFVWAIIFSYFAAPREFQHRVLFLGVLGALVFRGAFIAAGSVLISSFGIAQRNEHLDPEQSRALRVFRRWIPMTDAYHGQRFLIRKNGVLLATPLLAVLVLVEVTDIVFAVDSPVLIWVGIKMLLKIDVFYIPTTISLAVVALILGVSVVTSMIATRGQGRRAVQVPQSPPFRVATQEEIAATTSVWRRSPERSR